MKICGYAPDALTPGNLQVNNVFVYLLTTRYSSANMNQKHAVCHTNNLPFFHN